MPGQCDFTSEPKFSTVNGSNPSFHEISGLSDEQAEREAIIAQSHEVAGQIRSASLFAKFGTVTSLMWLRQAKESKAYKNMAGVGTWEKYCKYLGLSRRMVDENLKNLQVLGEELLVTVTNLSVGYRELRKLRQIVNDGKIAIDADYVVIDEEKIPISSDHADELQEAINCILTAHVNEKEALQGKLKEEQKEKRKMERLLSTAEKDRKTHSDEIRRLESILDKKENQGLQEKYDELIFTANKAISLSMQIINSDEIAERIDIAMSVRDKMDRLIDGLKILNGDIFEKTSSIDEY